jgi:hypothetical protein
MDISRHSKCSDKLKPSYAVIRDKLFKAIKKKSKSQQKNKKIAGRKTPPVAECNILERFEAL